MEYITIYTGDDQTEISIIRNLLEENNIKYNVLGEAIAASAGIGATGNMGTRIQVPKDEVDHAKTVLLETGFLGNWHKGKSKRRSSTRYSKWVLIFLAALVLIIVSFLIMWFMNP
jgi:hypothetical protein